MMEINQRKTGAILSYINLALSSAIAILYTPIMLRLMGQSEYGLYSLVASVICYLTILDLGLGNAMIRYTAKYRAINDKKSEEKLNGMFLILYAIVGVVVLIIGLVLCNNVSSIFSRSLNVDELKKAKILLLILVCNLAVSFPLGIFSSIIAAYEKFIFPNVISIIRTILMPFIMIPLLLAGYRSIAMVIIISVLNVMGLLINVGYCFKKLKIKIAFKKIEFTLLKEIAAYSFFIFLNVIVDKLYMNTDQFVLGIVSGTVAVSVYAIAMQLYNYYVMFSTSINGVFLPKLTKIATTDKSSKQMSEIFVRIGRLQFLVLVFILSGFILFGKQFLQLWAGEGYINAYYICLIIMVPAIIPLSQNIGITILQAKNMHQFRSIVYLFIAILNVVISIPLAKLYGGIGAAIGTSLATVVGQICTMNWFYYKKVGIDIPEYWKQIFKLSICVLGTLLFGFIINRLIVTETWISLIIKMVIFSLYFVTFIWRFAMNNYEKGLISPIIRKIHTIN